MSSGVVVASAESVPAQGEREAPIVVGVRVSSDGFGSYIADSAMGIGALYPGDVREPLMTVAQHERIVASLARPAQAEQKPIAWARQCDLDEAGPAIFVALEEVEESGYIVPLYAGPVVQREQPPIGYTTAGMLAIAQELPLTGRIGVRCHWDERWNVPVYAAPIAQTAQQPEQSELVAKLERVKLTAEEARHHSVSAVAYWNNAVTACIAALADQGGAK